MSSITQKGQDVKFKTSQQVEKVLEHTAREEFFESLTEKMREFSRMMLEATVEEELTQFLGYTSYQRIHKKNNSRNGHYKRNLATRLGFLESLKVARDRSGNFQSIIIPRYKRKEQWINQRIFELFVTGASTRKMKYLTKKLFGRGYSAGTVSNINKQLTDQVRQWMNGPITDRIVYLFVDAVHIPVRRRTVSKESLLTVVGITDQGKRILLAMQLGDREKAGSWKEFFKNLKVRGLKSEAVRLGIMDGLPGLEQTFREEFPNSEVQRCMVHKLRNVSCKVPHKLQEEVMRACKEIFYAKDADESRQRFREWKKTYQHLVPAAVECLEKDLGVCLTFYYFPKLHWISIRTTNIIERVFREFRRRIRQMDALQGEDAALRILYALATEINTRWEERHVRGYREFTQ
jgi:putative transposase